MSASQPSHEHTCDFMPKKGIAIYRNVDSKLLRDYPTWQLLVSREASEADLETNHILEGIGEIIWSTYLEITHCPYCGAYLETTTPGRPADYGRFAHMDYSQWKARRC